MHSKVTADRVSLPPFDASRRSEASRMFRVGLQSSPYLADHGFQDLVVVPGSLYVESAIRAHGASMNEQSVSLRDLVFQKAVLLSEQDSVLTVSANDRGNGDVEYRFYEGPNRGETDLGKSACCARVTVEARGARKGSTERLDRESFIQRAVSVMAAAAFYDGLRANGNQYGPKFQTVVTTWLSGREVLGKIQLPQDVTENETEQSRSLLIDGAVQILARLSLEKGRTFILKSVDQLEIFTPVLPSELWVRATLRPESSKSDDELLGDVDAYSNEGFRCFVLRGVRFSFLDRTQAEGDTSASSTRIVVAANFTAEPVEESLRFWSDFLDTPITIDFAPYNQIFQELLDPAGRCRNNERGVNVLLLNPQDWLRSNAKGLSISTETADRRFKDLRRHILPNGMEIAHLNRHETEYLYREIFEGQTYLRHGIKLNEGDTVVDIGANIGLFSLFVASRARNTKVIAFEPNPVLFPILRANCDAYSSLLHPVNLGVSDRRGTASFRFYENASVFSSFHPDGESDRQAIEAVVRNMLQSEVGADERLMDELVTELMADRLQQRTFDCGLVSVSEIIREHNLQRINLLKVDAEKSELEVLHGIAEEHWPLIDQIVIEVHDRSRAALTAVENILTRRGFTCKIEEETLLSNSGLFNVYAKRNLIPSGHQSSDSESLAFEPTHLQTRVAEFLNALEAFRHASTSPLVVCICPSDEAGDCVEIRRDVEQAEWEIVNHARRLPNVIPITRDELLEHCPSEDFFDPDALDLGHIPYSSEGFAAIGTRVFRMFTMLRRPPYKAVILDCDNTLWDGACGEEGPTGVRIEQAHQELQRFIIENMNAGMLVCLCSKNREEDVFEVFDQRSEMLLKRNHLAAWRINWVQKSGNIRSLARELGLGMESLIFIDDNPVECAEVRASCPEVLVIHLPQEKDTIAKWLENVWAFDHATVTEEDRGRTRMYQENMARESFRTQASSLKAFLDGLELRVDVADLEENQLNRASQLTYRTNQFNLTTIRRSESELRGILERPQFKGLAVHVRDRFGDYGLVGLILYEVWAERYRVDTFLLSCRVLGKGVEHRALREVGRRAHEEGKKKVEIRYVPSARNEPAAVFLGDLGTTPVSTNSEPTIRLVDSDKLAELEYQPKVESQETGIRDRAPAHDKNATALGKAPSAPDWNNRVQAIADQLFDSRRVIQAIENTKANKRNASSQAQPLDTTLEGSLLRIWRSVLDRPDLGVSENFFDAGGTSLKAVRVVSLIRKELGRKIRLVTLFECPTVRRMAERLDTGTANESGPEKNEALQRGRQRRQKLIRKKRG